MALCGFMGVASAGAYICYTNAFRLVGSPSATFDYALRLGFSPWFVGAVLMSALTIFARPFIYEALGGQRGYFQDLVYHINLKIRKPSIIIDNNKNFINVEVEYTK